MTIQTVSNRFLPGRLYSEQDIRGGEAVWFGRREKINELLAADFPDLHPDDLGSVIRLTALYLTCREATFAKLDVKQ
jgi:hypothetical protein